MYILIKFNVIF